MIFWLTVAAIAFAVGIVGIIGYKKTKQYQSSNTFFIFMAAFGIMIAILIVFCVAYLYMDYIEWETSFELMRESCWNFQPTNPNFVNVYDVREANAKLFEYQASFIIYRKYGVIPGRVMNIFPIL